MRYTLLVLAALMLAGCSGQKSAFDPSAPHLSKQKTLKWLSTQQDGASFVSRNGKMYGMDSDTKIILKNNGSSELFEYGFVGQRYSGTYSVDKSGGIHLELKKYPSTWPAMYLYKTADGVFLFPADKDPKFHMGGHAGAVQTGDMAPFWPFKKVN